MHIEGEYVKCAKLTITENDYQISYEGDYLELKHSIAIDPQNLPLYSRVETSDELFGSITDSAPDFWGRELLNRKFKTSELSEIEYVVANGLEHVGALAFSPVKFDTPMKLTLDGWIPHKKSNAVLEQIMEQTELMLKDVDGEKLKELFEYGPTLGGGKPKVSLVLDNRIYLAKYGTSQDSTPEQKIEFATMRMARDIGFNIPMINLSKHLNRDVYMIERFDRKIQSGSMKRYHFVSALSLCGWHEFGKGDWSYPVFCDFLRKAGSKEDEIRADLKELFKRIAFNIAVNNNDDHPRNHGLLCKNGKWRLSPLYDVVPKAIGGETFTMAMTIGLHGTEASKKNLLTSARYFEINDDEAELIIDDVNNFVSENWREYFNSAGIKAEIIDRFENAMRIK